jgi:hypothetical protein
VLLVLLPAAALAKDKSPAYSADVLTVLKGGVTLRSHVWSDGVHLKIVSEDGLTVIYSDLPRNLTWQWGAKGCVPLPPSPKEKEEIVGRETVGGHPTRKVKLTTTVKGKTGTTTDVAYEWRATDLEGVPIRREGADDSFHTELRNVVLGMPDAAKLASPCDAGFRTIPFFDAGCKQFVPLPIEMSIPSDYAIRAARPRGCFWGAEEDLDRVLASPSEVDFTGIHRGVYWCRSSEDTEFDPVHQKFVNAAGPQENWPAAFAAQGVKDLVLTPKTVNGIATLRVSGALHGKRVYLLYLGFGDSPAVLISYTPPAAGGTGDAAEWARFLESARAPR